MFEQLTDSVGAYAGHPVLQAIAAGVSTFILEDPAVIACGLLVAAGEMKFIAAFIGLSIGICLGDLGLYGIGRFARTHTVRWKWFSVERLEKARDLSEDNFVWAIIASRFLPGTRLPTYVGAGLVGVSFAKFFMIAVVASFVWTLTLLMLSVHLGGAILEALGAYRWWVIGGIVLAFAAWRLYKWKFKAPKPAPAESPLSSFELWPPYIFYIPVAFYYAFLAIRYRSLSLPSLANPSIYSGGICRESKSEILDLVKGAERANVAAYIRWDRATDAPADEAELDAIRAELAAHDLAFPIVAKPDIGQRGAGVRLLHNESEFAAYMREYRSAVPVMFQQFADYPHEAGILYFRHPKKKRGKIISITLKEFPEVTGDGKATLRALILKDVRASKLAAVYLKRHAARLDEIVPEGEKVKLVFSGNHCQGAVFRNGNHLVTKEMTAAMARMFETMPEFYFGRLDLRFKDAESLAAGENFLVVEINGASAESTHIWDARTKLSEAYRALFRQFRILFEIGAANRRRGFKPIGALAILRDFRAYRANARHYPTTS